MWRVGAVGRGCGGKVIEGWGGGGSEAESRDLNVKKKVSRVSLHKGKK